MDINAQGENVNNAFSVIKKTYESVKKMLSCIDNLADDFQFMTISPKFLRYKSDLDPAGYYITSFIKLYQSKLLPNHSSLETIKNGPVFVVEVVFAECNTPKVFISKFKFDNINSWDYVPGVSNYDLFYYPVRNKNECKEIVINESFKRKVFSDEKFIENYWGLREVIYTDLDLLEIDTEEAIKEKILARFSELDKYDS
jgi:hypothetical protein